MSFNISKYKILSVTRSSRKVNYNYSINGIVLEHAGTYRDLGIIVDCKLNWSTHIQSVKHGKVCNMVKCSIGYIRLLLM